MKRKFMKILILTMLVGVLFSFMNEHVEAASSGNWIAIGGGWEFRIDPPHTDSSNAKYHVHARNKKLGKSGSEGVDGSKSHGDNMNDVPDKVKKKIKDHDEYKKGKKKQKKLKKATQEVKTKKLKIDWKHISDVIVAIGIVVLSMGFFIFQGDDIAAWINLFRALGIK